MNWLQYCVVKGHVAALKTSACLQNCSVRSDTTSAALLVNLIKKVPAILKSARLHKQGLGARDEHWQYSTDSDCFYIAVRQSASFACIVLYGMHPQ